MAATFAQRIQDLIGFDYSSNSINTENEAIHTAFAEIVDTVPDSILIKYARMDSNTLNGTNPDTTFDTKGKKIVRVIRKESTGGPYRECEFVDAIDFDTAYNDSSSIYYRTNFSPVWTAYPNGTQTYMKVRPTPTDNEPVTIYYLIYLTGNDDVDGADSTTSIPNEFEHAVALRAALYILQTMISDTIQDDEDDEMLNMLNNQQQSLQAMYQVEMQRLTGEKGQQMGE
tara:strand:+ start:537 stop:1220 length:684 start_codon:yes stop_codon:yes gene_type:complete